MFACSLNGFFFNDNNKRGGKRKNVRKKKNIAHTYQTGRKRREKTIRNRVKAQKKKKKKDKYGEHRMQVT